MTALLETLALLGVSYRQIDYWTSRGLVLADECSPGSGYQRTWSEQELSIASAIGSLTRCGLELGVAAKVARANIVHGRSTIPIGEGVSVVITPAPDLDLDPWVLEP